MFGRENNVMVGDSEEEFGISFLDAAKGTKFFGTAAHYGGDEFIYALELVDEDAAIRIAIRICSSISTTMTIKNQTFSIHGSIGIALYPEHGSTSEELVSKADLALYSAKQAGKNQYILCDETSFIT